MKTLFVLGVEYLYFRLLKLLPPNFYEASELFRVEID